MNELAAALDRVASAKTVQTILEAGIDAARVLFEAETAAVVGEAGALSMLARDVPAWAGSGLPRRQLGLEGEGTTEHALAMRLSGAGRWLLTTRTGRPFTEVDVGSAILFAAFLSQTTRALEEAEEVAAQQSIYRTLVEQLPAVTYYRKLGSPGGDAWFVSPQVRDLLGLEPEAFTRGPEQWRTMLHPDDRDWVMRHQAEFDPTRTTTPIHVEYRMVRRDGAVIWVQNTALAVRDPDGTARFVLGVLTDVTERKRAEEELRQSLKREAVSRLAAGVAHDFNNVLGTILAYASLLRDETGEDDHDKRLALDEIAASARRGYELTRELTAIADAEAPRSKPASRSSHPRPSPGPTVLSDAAPETKTILLVDDEDAVRRASVAILVRRGYRVIAAASGDEALATLARADAKVDLLLTDVIMPEMGGRELAERGRALRPDLKVAFVSGFTDDEVLRKAVLDADCALLQKPFSAAELLAHVRSVIAG